MDPLAFRPPIGCAHPAAEAAEPALHCESGSANLGERAAPAERERNVEDA